MPYQITWEVPETVLYLKLLDQVSMEEFIEINEQINAYLDERNTTDRTVLKIDIVEAQSVPQQLSRMKMSQTYAERHDLKWLLVVGDNKSIRLIMLLTFNLSRAILQFVDNDAQSERFLQNIRVITR
jgi:hypothetical protein